MSMSGDIKESLLLGNQLNDEAWKKLVENAIAALLGKPEIHSA